MWTQKLTHFIIKFYFCLPKKNKERKSGPGMETSFDLLSMCLFILEFSFDTMLRSILGNKNSNAGDIKCSHRLHLACGSQVPHSCYTQSNSRAKIVLLTQIALSLKFSTKITVPLHHTNVCTKQITYSDGFRSTSTEEGSCGPLAKCGLREHFIWPTSEFSLPKLKYNIASK